jgi:hypothetical protein
MDVIRQSAHHAERDGYFDSHALRESTLRLTASSVGAFEIVAAFAFFRGA